MSSTETATPMQTPLITPLKTPIRRNPVQGNSLSTPLLVPPSPMLQELGYGTGVHVYRIERSPIVGKMSSPWVVKRLRGRTNEDSAQKKLLFGRLVGEANILKKLDHPNIIGYRGTKTLSDKNIVLAMETCDTSLGDVLEARLEKDEGPLEAMKISKMSLDVCKALDYLHTKALILHGDLKSFNILIKGDFELCKLCDFGVSSPLNEEGYLDLKNSPNARYTGTDLWSAPEVFFGTPEDISTKTDMFSFGMIIYECVALQAPHIAHVVTDDADDSCMSMNSTATEDTEQEDDAKENDQPPSKQPKKLFSDVNESDTSMKSNDICPLDRTADSEELSYVSDGTDLVRSNAATIGDESKENIEAYLGTRPPIPDVYSLPVDYNVVLEIFFLCTNELPENRPSANFLATFLRKNQK